MHAHTNMNFVFSGDVDAELKSSVHQLLVNKVDDDDVYENDDSFMFEESYRLVWYEDLVAFAEEVAALCHDKVGFVMDGVIDTSESAGEYMDYHIEFADNKLMAQCSPWYLFHNGTQDWDDNYEEFCECTDTEEDMKNGTHRLSEEDFEKLKEIDEWCSPSGCDFEVWLEVPLLEPEEIPYNC